MKHLIEYQEWVKTGIVENFQGERFDISSLEDKDRAVWFYKNLTFKI